jgi:ribosomal protein S18 acetylase RimI-like enzyme
VNAMAFHVRVMRIEDVPQAVRLKDLAGWNQTAADWQRFLSADTEGSFVAELDGQVIGTSATITYEERLAWIGMVVVDPQHRARGIGKALLGKAIHYLDSKRIPCVKLDATPQGKPLYEKFGFVSEFEIERWMLARMADPKSALPDSIEIDGVLQLDREIFGVDRGGLLRTVQDAHPEFTLLARRPGGIAGYAFARRGSRADHLGPWMADSERVAAQLLDTFLERAGDRVFVDCVVQNPFALPLVRARGFEFSRPLTRMFRGSNKHPGQPARLCAILGPEFG